MKKIIRFPLLILSLAFVVISCDYVNWEDNEINAATNTKDTVRKILIEDFTGHKCPNCPGGHEAIEDLHLLYGNQVVAIAVHAGYFASPDANGHYTYDFNTAVGTEIHDHFGFTSLPKGLVNRLPKDGGTNVILPVDDWRPQAKKLIEDQSTDPDAYIHLEANFNDADSTLGVDAEVTFFTPSADVHKYNLVVMITENKIIKPQDDDGAEVLDYVHNHVLRGGLNGAWGEEIHEGSVATSDKFNKSYTGYKFGSDWNPDNCHVVAYLMYFDGAEKYQVIQAQEINVK